MQTTSVELSFEEMLASERPRLVRLCARLSGSNEAAEDVAQEVLLVAWRHAARLHAPEDCGAWLSGIARNICLAWSRRHYREQARLVTPQQAGEAGGDPTRAVCRGFGCLGGVEAHGLAPFL